LTKTKSKPVYPNPSKNKKTKKSPIKALFVGNNPILFYDSFLDFPTHFSSSYHTVLVHTITNLCVKLNLRIMQECTVYLFAMGNLLSTNCYICSQKVAGSLHVKCFECNQRMHFECEETYRKGRRHCKCPRCESIGTLALCSPRKLNPIPE